MEKKVVLIFVCIFAAVAVSVSAQDGDKSKSSPPTESTVAHTSLSSILSQAIIFLYEDKTPPNSDQYVAGRILGTAFIIGIPISEEEPEQGIPLIVTAKHVIANRSKILGRYSLKVGGAGFVQYDLEALRKSNDLWEYSEDEGVDIVLFRTLSYETTQKLMIPVKWIASKEIYKSEDINAADRVIIPCLLSDYPGTTHNYPIFRDGSIALITEEPIELSWKLGNKLITTKQKIIFINSTLNEGFSGAPVFLWPGLRSNRIGGTPWLLGIVHGFQAIYRNVLDSEGENVAITKPAREPHNFVEIHLPERNVNIISQENSATGIIFPSWQILDILKSDAVKKKVEEISEELRRAKSNEKK